MIVYQKKRLIAVTSPHDQGRAYIPRSLCLPATHRDFGIVRYLCRSLGLRPQSLPQHPDFRSRYVRIGINVSPSERTRYNENA